MAKSADVSLMNVSAIRLVDKAASEIIDSATHVALYEFNEQSYEWEKTNAEGALFVYSRHREQSRYSFIVLNRLNTSNLVEPINENIDLQLQEPFLLYKNSKAEIHGIWFLQKEECSRIARTIENLVRDISKTNMDTSLVKTSDSIEHKQVETPDGTSKKVMDFFLRAGSKTPSQPSAPRAPPGMTNLSRGKQLLSPGISNVTNKQFADVNPLLQRLLSNSNPITVEQLEKQQRSSPQDIPTARGSRTVIKKECTSRRPMTLPVQSSPKIENGMDLLHLTESPPQSGSTPSSVPTHLYSNTHSPLEPLEVRMLEQSVTMETAPKPALIPPVMFASSKEEPLIVKPEPLTKSQLLQAVTYLLKNDADFVNKLHEAYVKSFVDMVS